MLIKQPPAIRSSEITDERDYLDRREFVRAASGAALAAAAAATPGLLGRETRRLRRRSRR